jgi:hypothetical protein
MSSTAFTSPFSSLLQGVASSNPNYVPPGQWFPGFQAENPAPSFQSNVPHIADPPFGGFAGAAAAPAAGGGGGGGGAPSAPPGLSVGDYGNDPIYQQAQAAVQAQMKAAEAQAQATRNVNYIRYGDPALAQAGGADSKSVEAARNNSFGTVQELGRWNSRSLAGIDTARSSQNLFYSSTRARDRSLQEEDLIRQKTTTGNQLQDVITGIAQGLLAQKQQAQMTLLSAAEAAYGRALQMAMFNAQMAAYPTGAGGGGGGGGGAPASPAAAAAASGGGIPQAKAALGYGTTIPWTAGL